MPVLNVFAAALAWLGRQGTRAVAASVFVGLAVPSLAAFVKPHLGETVFVLLLFSYLRTDPAAFRSYVRRPRLVLIAALWAMVALPLLFGTLYAVSGLPSGLPALYTIMILHIAVAPITSSAAFAGLLGLDVALSLTTLIVASAISPVSTVAFSYLFLGTSLFSPIELGLKLFFFFAATGAAAFALCRLLGQPWLDRKKDMLDGPERDRRVRLRGRRNGRRAAACGGRSTIRVGDIGAGQRPRRRDRRAELACLSQGGP